MAKKASTIKRPAKKAARKPSSQRGGPKGTKAKSAAKPKKAAPKPKKAAATAKAAPKPKKAAPEPKKAVAKAKVATKPKKAVSKPNKPLAKPKKLAAKPKKPLAKAKKPAAKAKKPLAKAKKPLAKAKAAAAKSKAGPPKQVQRPTLPSPRHPPTKTGKPAPAPVVAKAAAKAPPPPPLPKAAPKLPTAPRAPLMGMRPAPARHGLATGKDLKPSAAARRPSPSAPPARMGTGRPSIPPGSPKVELAPRRHVSVAPSIPLPVQAVPRKPTLQQRAKRIDQRLGKQTEDFLHRYQENFDMSWIYHDAALEGVVYTYAELTAALRGEEAGPALDSSVAPIFEAIRRQKAAIDYVRNVAAKKRTPVNVEMVKQIYTILHPEEGDIKTVKYRRDVPQHRLYFHEYAAPDKVTYRVRQVVDWLNDPETRKKVGTLRMAAKAHYDLARTYPFPIDSGKVARLFMNVLLMRGGLPPAIIHATERQRYYEALKAGSPSFIVGMLRDSVENSMASIEKLLDEFETRKRAFVS